MAAETVRRAERVRTERREPVVVRGGGPRGPAVEARREWVTASVVVQSSFSITISIAVGGESEGIRDSGPDGDEPRHQPDQNANSSSPREEQLQQTTAHQSNNSSSPSSANESITRTSAIPAQEHPTTASVEEEQVVAAAAAETAEPLQTVSDPSPSAQSQPQHGSSHHTHRNRRTIEGECSICCEDLSDGETTWCRAQCGQNFHADCMSLWHAAQEADETEKTCPYW